MRRSRFVLVAVTGVALCLAGARPAARAQERYASREHGFEFTPPSGWACYGADGHAQGVRYVVAAYPRGTTSGVPSLQVSVCDVVGEPTPTEVRDAALAAMSERPELRDRRRGTRRLLDREWPTIVCAVTAPDGREAGCENTYVRANGQLFVLTRTCAVDDAEGARLLDAALASFGLSHDRDERRLRAYAERCGERLPWADTWAQAVGRARAERRLIAVVYEQVTALQIPRMAASGPLSDPDVAALLEERFVVLRVGPQDRAPFRERERYGMSEYAWGSTLLFVTPDGDLVREAGQREPTFVDQVAREALAAVPWATGPHRPRPADPEGAATVALRRGELTEVFTLLGDLETPRAHQLRAAVHRRRRHGQPALTALEAARRGLSAVDDPARRRALERDLDADEALVRLRLGQLDAARRLWSRVAADLDAARAAEALYWLGVVATMSAKEGEARRSWGRAITRSPDDPWAWKAAANLLKTGAFMNGVEPLTWPSDDVLRDMALVRRAGRPRPDDTPPAPDDDDAVADARRGAVRYLIESQRPTGAWPCPVEDLSLIRAGYGEAITSICATSLLPFAVVDGDPAARAAVERALAYVLAARGRLLGAQHLNTTYRTWARAYALRFFVRCAQAGLGDAAALRPAIDELVADLAARQGAAGGWAYLAVPGDPTGEGVASSFLSAAVLLALCEARDLGADVPAAALERGAGFLERLRREDGTFRYAPDLDGISRGDSHPEAAGRSPLCALALRRASGEAADLEPLRRALAAFFAHRAVLADQLGKDLCHTGPDGQASYYFAFGHAYAADAILALPATDERAFFAARLSAALLAARLDEGTWVDMPGLGRPYATAMALLSLDALFRARD